MSFFINRFKYTMGDVFDTPELITMAHASNPSIPDEDPQTEINSMIRMVIHLREMADRRELKK